MKRENRNLLLNLKYVRQVYVLSKEHAFALNMQRKNLSDLLIMQSKCQGI